MRLMRRPRSDSPLARWRNQIDAMFEHPDIGASDLFSGWTPAVDVLEDKQKLTVKAELPGFKREDIDVSLHENNLSIMGERKCADEQKEGEYYRCERYFGKFHRVVPLPSSVDTGKIDAKYSNGILTVTLPKSEKAKSKQIEVSAG
jgi:HSP20 family protein